MPEIRIGKGKVFINRVEGKYELSLVDRLRYTTRLEMSKEQLITLGKSLIAYAQGDRSE